MVDKRAKASRPVNPQSPSLPPETRTKAAETVPPTQGGQSVSLTSDGEVLLQTFSQKFSELKNEFLLEFRNEIASLMKEKDEKIYHLEQQISLLKQDNRAIGRRLDDLENENHQNTIILSGDGQVLFFIQSRNVQSLFS